MAQNSRPKGERPLKPVSDSAPSQGSGGRSLTGRGAGILRALLEAVPLGAHIYALRPDGSLVFVGANPAADRILRTDNSTFVGKTIEEAFPALVGGPIPDAYRNVARTGAPCDTQLVMYSDEKISGAFEVSAFQPGPNGVVTLFRDVTERLRIEQELEKSSERLRNFVSGVPVVLFALDRNGRFTLSEGMGLAALGLKPGQVLGASVFDVYADSPEITSAVRRSLAGEVVSQVVTAGGRSFQSRYQPLLDESGSVTEITGVAIDVTDQLALERQLQHSQKMESIGRLAGGIAHDFNNLLTVILGFSEMVLATLGEETQAWSDLQEAMAAARKAANLTTKLLGFARKQPAAPRITNLNEAVIGAEKMIRRMLAEDIEIVVCTTSAPWPIVADPNQLDLILVNLSINARDAMPRGGRIVIETINETVNEFDASRFTLRRPGDYAVLSMSDTGVGMTEEVQTHLFEPFFTTKEPGKGTGLGLATCHGIVRQNGGQILAFSEPGSGTTFRIYLPRSESSVPPAPAPADAEPSVRGDETVLLAEDEPAVRALAQVALRANGYTVIEAATGEEALAAARSHPGPIHILVSDVIMPGMGGRELADRLTAMHKDVAVLFISGHPPDVIAQAGAADSDDGFLQKPFMPGQLLRAVRESLDRSRPAQ
jgi:two-component system, cell cycle sensor histidine kinase and response regulator CckA